MTDRKNDVIDLMKRHNISFNDLGEFQIKFNTLAERNLSISEIFEKLWEPYADGKIHKLCLFLAIHFMAENLQTLNDVNGLLDDFMKNREDNIH
jgi:hypothetical protein